MLRLSVLLSMVVFCASVGFDDLKIDLYAQKKIMETCYGEEYSNNMYSRMEASSKKCSSQPQFLGTNDIDFQDVIDEVRNMALPWGSRPENSAQFFQLMPAQGGRSKRHASEAKHKHTTAKKLYHMKEKMAFIIGNMTCMFRDLKWMKEDKTPNFDIFQKAIDFTPGSQEFKDDLLWGLDVCKDFSMCVSPQRAKSPFMKELGTYITFHKCFKMKGFEACMKKDYREYAAKEGSRNIDEILDMGLGKDMKHQKKDKIGLNALETVLSGDLIF